MSIHILPGTYSRIENPRVDGSIPPLTKWIQQLIAPAL